MDKKITKVLGIKVSKETEEAVEVEAINAKSEDDEDDDDMEEEEEGNAPRDTEEHLADALGVDEKVSSTMQRGFLSQAVLGQFRPTRKTKMPSHEADPGRSWMLAVMKLFNGRVTTLGK